MSKLNPSGAPPETKTVASGAYGGITWAVTWVLVNYVLKGQHIDPQLQTMITGLVPVVVGTAAGWLSKHTPRYSEVLQVAQQLLAAEQQQQRQAAVQPRQGGPRIEEGPYPGP